MSIYMNHKSTYWGSNNKVDNFKSLAKVILVKKKDDTQILLIYC